MKFRKKRRVVRGPIITIQFTGKELIFSQDEIRLELDDVRR